MDKIKFVSDLELAIFLFRRFSEKFETRQLVKIAHLPTVSRLEQIIQQKPDWRICENELQDLISNHFLTDELRGAFDNFEFIVAGDRENEWIEEKFELKISKAEENIVENVEDFKEHIDLIGCILSLAIDQKNSWSASRLFTILCPQILPTLKKLAADGRLTIFQTLLSYVMKSNIADNYDSTNEVLNEHIHFLRQFDRAIDKIQEQIGNTEGCSKRSLLQSVNIAAQFLLSTDKFSFCSKIRTAQNFLKTHIEEVHRNFKIFNNISSRVCKKPIFISEAQLICYHFLDRLTALDTIEVKQNSVSPNFKFLESFKFLEI
ncbi:hypothetical protein WR25_14562 isoform B [Diploscapter pachys]|uniref:Uncharacterized protein n=1 Tax=Diploscapter pachys TaxID=2018661 RepID=A0A2A2L4L9_9BILA|nr:hypothetical protein WR25_14562 isoform B [Diploscapter pachys]